MKSKELMQRIAELEAKCARLENHVIAVEKENVHLIQVVNSAIRFHWDMVRDHGVSVYPKAFEFKQSLFQYRRERE